MKDIEAVKEILDKAIMESSDGIQIYSIITNKEEIARQIVQALQPKPQSVIGSPKKRPDLTFPPEYYEDAQPDELISDEEIDQIFGFQHENSYTVIGKRIAKAQHALDEEEWQAKVTKANQLGWEAGKAVGLEDCQKRIEQVLELGDKTLELASHADYSNGVEAFGMDEGKVRGYEMLKNLEEKWEALKAKIKEGEDGS